MAGTPFRSARCACAIARLMVSGDLPSARPIFRYWWGEALIIYFGHPRDVDKRDGLSLRERKSRLSPARMAADFSSRMRRIRPPVLPMDADGTRRQR